jgi:hypothetical protein
MQCRKKIRHSIVFAATASSVSEIAGPGAFAVLRLMTCDIHWFGRIYQGADQGHILGP